MALIAGCADRVILSDEITVKSEAHKEDLIIEIWFDGTDIDSIIPEGDVAYLYIFECGESENFKVFYGDPVEFGKSNLVFRYEVPREDPFISDLTAICGQFKTTGYSFRKTRTDAFEIGG